METLSKDVKFEMALNLSPRDVLSFCLTSKKNSDICNSDIFWYRKTMHDYANLRKYKLERESWKRFYIRIIRDIAKLIMNTEIITNFQPRVLKIFILI